MKQTMKKVMMLFSALVILSSCADVEGYENNISTLETENEELSTHIVSLEKEKEELNDELIKITDENKKIQEEYDQYKERMSPYEELEESEAEARKIEADKIAAQEKEAAEKKKAEEEAAKKAEEEAAKQAEEEELARGYETGITYDQLARTPDDYVGEKVKFSGKVVQVMEGTDEIQLRLAVNDNYDQIIYLAYSPEIVEQRVLEDDYLTIYGHSFSTITYESTLGGNITIPAVLVDIVEFN